MGSTQSASIYKEQEQEQAPPPGYLLVRAAQYHLLIPASPVRHILPAQTHLGGAEASCEPSFLGLVVVGHGAMPVFDLGMRLGLTVTSGPIVILQNSVQAWTGLRTDAVVESLCIPHGNLRPMLARSRLPFARWVSASWPGRSRTCYLLNLESLFPAPYWLPSGEGEDVRN